MYFSLNVHDSNLYLEAMYIVFREKLSEMLAQTNYHGMIKYFEQFMSLFNTINL